MIFKRGIVHLAKSAAKENVRLRACIHGDEVVRGIKSARNNGPIINVAVINQALEAAQRDFMNYVREGHTGGDRGDSAGAGVSEGLPPQNGNGQGHQTPNPSQPGTPNPADGTAASSADSNSETVDGESIRESAGNQTNGHAAEFSDSAASSSSSGAGNGSAQMAV